MSYTVAGLAVEKGSRQILQASSKESSTAAEDEAEMIWFSHREGTVEEEEAMDKMRLRVTVKQEEREKAWSGEGEAELK